jgi:hypothetical protein
MVVNPGVQGKCWRWGELPRIDGYRGGARESHRPACGM